MSHERYYLKGLLAAVDVAGDVLLEPRLGGRRAPEHLAARPQALVLEVLLLLVRILTSRVGVLKFCYGSAQYGVRDILGLFISEILDEKV